MRRFKKSRKTKETDINISIDLDGKGNVVAETGIPFLDHMLDAFGRHGMFDLTVKAKGDLEVDCHHTIEDIGIVLGQAIAGAVGNGKGIARFSHMAVPMDESIAYVTLDCGGRAYLVMDGTLGDYPVSGIPGDLLEHFFYSLCSNANITAHISFEGKNAHHKCEAVFKAFGIALRMATRVDPEKGIPSTKGVI